MATRALMRVARAQRAEARVRAPLRQRLSGSSSGGGGGGGAGPKGVTVVRDRAGASRALDVLRSQQVRTRFHAVDTEAVDIDAKVESPVGNGRVICASVFAGDDVDFGSGPRLFIDNLDEAEGTLELFKDYLEDESILKVWHNYGFDRHILFNHGINVRGFGGDTMQMARLWNAARTVDGGYSLEALSFDLLGDRKRPIMERFGRPKPKKDGSPGKVLVFPDLADLQRNTFGNRDEWVDYSTFDTVATWRVREELEKKLRAMPWAKDKSMYDFYVQYWRPFGELLTDMEREGIYIRVRDGYLRSIHTRALADRAAAAQHFIQWASKYSEGAKYMNVSSDAQKQQFFFAPAKNRKGEVVLEAERVFEKENTEAVLLPGDKKPKRTIPFVIRGLGLPVRPNHVTAAGRPAVSLEVLRSLAGEDLDAKEPKWGTAYEFFGGGDEGKEACQAIDALCRVSAIDTLLSNFIESLMANADPNSRIHCSLNLNTETGRLSSRKPNLQNQPALEKDIYKIRDAFGADTSKGHTLIVADYGQLELRLLAHMTDCRSMIEAFRAGGDFHSRTAIGMYPNVAEAVQKGAVLLEWNAKKMGKAPAPLLKDVFATERRRAKVLNFSIAYGMTAVGLARDWGVSREEAEQTLELWYRDRPEVREWQRSTIERAKQDRATRTLMGRYRPLPDINSAKAHIRSHAERAAINTPIQGGAADVVMKAMLNLHAHQRFRELGWKLILQIHDEVIVEGPRDTAQEALEIVKHTMANPFANPLRVDLVVDAKIADTWYAAK